MAIIELIIPDDKLSRVTDMFKTRFPIPQINTGTSENPIWENEFTDNQWAKEKLKRLVIQWVHSFEKDEAEKAVSVQRDYALVS